MSPVDESLVKKLQAALPDLKILTPNSPGYEDSIKRFNPSCERAAGAVTYPTSAKEVSTIIVFSQEHSLDIAFRCGGHSQRGASSSDGGICVDLSRLQDVSVDLETKQVTVGGGALWGQVYETIEKHNLGVVSGGCLDVGVGGFTLVGGYGVLTGFHGVGLDTLIKAEVVLADGIIVTASDTENPDLLWALRGAGPCFGVVTSMTIQGYHTTQIFHGELVFPRSALPVVVEVANKVYETEGEASMVIYWRSPEFDDKPPMLVIDVHWANDDEAKAKEFYAPLLNFPPIDGTFTLKPMVQAGGRPPVLGSAQIWTSGAVMAPLDPAFLDSMIDDMNGYMEKVPDGNLSLLFFEIHSFYGTLKRSQTETAFANRGTFSNAVPILVRKNAKENEEETIAWARSINTKIHKELRRRKAEKKDLDENTRTGVGEYINYDSIGQGPKMLFGVNYEKLVELKKKYDPHNVFRKLVDLHQPYSKLAM